MKVVFNDSSTFYTVFKVNIGYKSFAHTHTHTHTHIYIYIYIYIYSLKNPNKLDQQTINSKFEYHYVLHACATTKHILVNKSGLKNAKLRLKMCLK